MQISPDTESVDINHVKQYLLKWIIRDECHMKHYRETSSSAETVPGDMVLAQDTVCQSHLKQYLST